MAHFKLVISDAKGRSISREIKDISAQPLLGSKIGDVLDSSIIGIGGGKIKVTGGSDKSGTPMRADVHGGAKKYVLLSRGVGMNNTLEGARVRKLVRGNLITEEIYQLNCSLLEGRLPGNEVKRGEGSPTENAT
ncbi:MAG TPA: S6e family ribosomal protein [Nitrososphaeraceae archaeon]